MQDSLKIDINDDVISDYYYLELVVFCILYLIQEK